MTKRAILSILLVVVVAWGVIPEVINSALRSGARSDAGEKTATFIQPVHPDAIKVGVKSMDLKLSFHATWIKFGRTEVFAYAEYKRQPSAKDDLEIWIPAGSVVSTGLVNTTGDDAANSPTSDSRTFSASPDWTSTERERSGSFHRMIPISFVQSNGPDTYAAAIAFRPPAEPYQRTSLSKQSFRLEWDPTLGVAGPIARDSPRLRVQMDVCKVCYAGADTEPISESETQVVLWKGFYDDPHAITPYFENGRRSVYLSGVGHWIWVSVLTVIVASLLTRQLLTSRRDLRSPDALTRSRSLHRESLRRRRRAGQLAPRGSRFRDRQ